MSTRTSGPCKNSIRHRRVLKCRDGSILHDQPYNRDQCGLRLPFEKCSTVTELWFDPRLTQFGQGNNLVGRPDGVSLQEDFHEGSDEIHMPQNSYVCFKAYQVSPV